MPPPNANQNGKIASRVAAIATAKPVEPAPAPEVVRPKRREGRDAVFRHGKVQISRGAMLNCIIVDFSVNGARIELNGAETLPDHVMLRLVSTGELKRAKVVWRRGNAAGLSFKIESRPEFANSKL
jgi:hypothetical protein